MGKKKKKRKGKKKVAVIIYTPLSRKKVLLLDPSERIRKRIPYSYRREKDKLIYYFDVAGVKEKDIQIKIKDKKLSIKAKTKEYSYYRRLNLPNNPKGKIKKNLKNGILEIQIPI